MHPAGARSARPASLASTPLTECSGCDGVWVEADAFERLCAERDAQSAVLHQFPSAKPARPDRVRYRPCVRCGKMMNRVNFGRISGIIVDVCKGHGTFVDPGELHRIVEFIAAGGLERARVRRLEELKDQERRARDAESRLARTRGKTPPATRVPPWNSWTFMVSRPEED